MSDTMIETGVSQPMAESTAREAYGASRSGTVTV
jgi:hypothetical protein